MSGDLHQLPDIVPRQGDRYDRLLVPVNDPGNEPFGPQPPRNTGTSPLVLRRVTLLDSYCLCVRHRSLALIHPATSRGPCCQHIPTHGDCTAHRPMWTAAT